MRPPRPNRNDLLERLRRADRRTTALETASRIAHDVGTPLNVIQARAQLLGLEPNLSDEAQRHLASLASAVDRVSQTLRAVLVATAYEVEGAEERVDALLALAVGCFESNPTAIEVDVAEDLVARVDVTVFAQVVTELLSNALRATPDGGAVRISARIEDLRDPPDPLAPPGSYLHITVAHDGAVITSEELSACIDPPRGERCERMARGLTVCASAVRAHDGFLEADTTPTGAGRVSAYFRELEAP